MGLGGGADRLLVADETLGAFGLPPIDMKSDVPVVLIILANGFIGASFGMIIFTSAIRAIPQHLFWAAPVDGAGLGIVRHITLPAIRWQISFVTIYQALSLLVSFEYIWLITDGGPFYDTTVFALYVYQRAFNSGQYAYGAALALVLVLIGIAAALILRAPDGHARAATAAAHRGHMSTAVLPLEQRRSTGRHWRPRRASGAGSRWASCTLPWHLGRYPCWCPISGSSRWPSPVNRGQHVRSLAYACGPSAGARPGLDRGPGGRGREPASPRPRPDRRRHRADPGDRERAASASEQLALPLDPGGRGRPEGRIRRRRQVPKRLDGIFQLARYRRRADGARRRHQHARRLLFSRFAFSGRPVFLQGLLVLTPSRQ